MKAEDIRHGIRKLAGHELSIQAAADWPRGAQWLCCLALVCVVIALCWWGLVRPDMRVLEVARQEESVRLEAYRRQVSRLAELPLQQARVARLQARLALLDGAFPASPGMAALIDALGAAAARHGVELSAMELQPVREEPPLRVHPVSLSVNGEYHALGRFLADVATRERLVTLHEARLSRRDKGLRLGLEVRAYQRVTTPAAGTSREEEDA
ncbi:type 4a pilus biogenesis protein PilO [Halomonas sp. 18H]|uniref:type 4a pilus biogenesis protein PilO n=1 Tax=Halomonas almeriensis TaxID=308163 RepID=UPI00223225AB|nr:MULTISPECIES: type 4a pilus biogenesis protein PilO [Halomonas]MCW4149695.1 type 4a pilus biogenesis protein PilO [Halomonas sp. 18H]MDN3553360.1 type 4a pilus biogenesis protein PilO [Halomonas almeriensis]